MPPLFLSFIRCMLFFVLSLQFLVAQDKILSPSPNLELISPGSGFENHIYYTIGESFIQYMPGREVKIQEGFLQTSILVSHSKQETKETLFDVEFEIYPNPTSGYAVIRIQDKIIDNSFVKYSIVNGLGMQCFSGHIQNQQQEIDMRNLPGGIYMVLIYKEDQILSSSKKIIKL